MNKVLKHSLHSEVFLLSPPRIQTELNGIKDDLAHSRGHSLRGTSEFASILKETSVSSNLRRLQQTLISFVFAQLSGANSVTSYFVPIIGIRA